MITLTKIRQTVSKVLPLAFVVSITVIAALVFYWPQPKQVDTYKEQIDAANKALDSIEQARKNIQSQLILKDQQIKIYERQNTELAIALHNNKALINEIRKQYETLNRFNNYNSDSIVRYFARHYGK